MKKYKLTIDETGRGCLKDRPERFNKVVEYFATLDEAKQFITERYGKLPKRHKQSTIYVDGSTDPIGFVRSYWTKDLSHNSPSWYQTDWVCVAKVSETPVLIN